MIGLSDPKGPKFLRHFDSVLRHRIEVPFFRQIWFSPNYFNFLFSDVEVELRFVLLVFQGFQICYMFVVSA